MVSDVKGSDPDLLPEGMFVFYWKDTEKLENSVRSVGVGAERGISIIEVTINTAYSNLLSKRQLTRYLYSVYIQTLKLVRRQSRILLNPMLPYFRKSIAFCKVSSVCQFVLLVKATRG